MVRIVIACLAGWMALACCALAQSPATTSPAVTSPVQKKPSREEKVRNDRLKVEADGVWIYNDLEKGFAEARESGKPLLVVLRCIPCEECVKLDDELVDKHPGCHWLRPCRTARWPKLTHSEIAPA